MFRSAAIVVFAVVSALPVASSAQDAALKAAIDGPQRSAENRARDGWRHPSETLAFWGVRPGVTVLEVSPGGGWWTEILAPYLTQTRGRYIVAAPAAGAAALQARFPNDNIAVVDFGRSTRGFGSDGSVDVAFTARNVHNWIAQDRVDVVFSDLFNVLKPGGFLGVEDHRADPNPMRPGASDGYVTEAVVIAAAEKAGFKFDGRSQINANPKDTKDHPFGVWTLPPVRQTAPRGQPADPAFDRAKYDAIGESDRMTLRFVKPG